MRNSRAATLIVVIAVFLSMPNLLSARVCHPKKPITCTAATFSGSPAVAVARPGAKSAATTVKAHVPAKTRQAMLCGPWVRWICAANNLG